MDPNSNYPPNYQPDRSKNPNPNPPQQPSQPYPGYQQPQPGQQPPIYPPASPPYQPQGYQQPVLRQDANYDPKAYNFIFNEENTAKKPSLSGGSNLGSESTIKKIGLVGGILVIVIIAIVVLSSLLKSPSPLPYFVSVAQDQTEIIHLASEATSQQIDSVNQNFVATATAVMTSNLTQLGVYTKAATGQTISVKQAALKESASVDQELTNAESGGVYDQTFQNTLNSEIKIYEQDLSNAYNKSDVNGKILFRSFYQQAVLLDKQLNSNNS